MKKLLTGLTLLASLSSFAGNPLASNCEAEIKETFASDWNIVDSTLDTLTKNQYLELPITYKKTNSKGVEPTIHYRETVDGQFAILLKDYSDKTTERNLDCWHTTYVLLVMDRACNKLVFSETSGNECSRNYSEYKGYADQFTFD